MTNNPHDPLMDWKRLYEESQAKLATAEQAARVAGEERDALNALVDAVKRVGDWDSQTRVGMALERAEEVLDKSSPVAGGPGGAEEGAGPT